MTIGPKKNKTESTVLSLIFGAIYIVNFDVLIEKNLPNIESFLFDHLVSV